VTVSRYARVNGVELYNEVHGHGPPLVMLHGGVTPSEMFGAPLAEMARAHKVVTPHAQGHGLSKDGSGPWSFEVFADDVAALMGHLGIRKASVMGYSSGALVALQTASRHPRLVDKVIVISTACRSDGDYPEVRQPFAQMPSAAPMIAAEVSKSPPLLGSAAVTQFALSFLESPWRDVGPQQETTRPGSWRVVKGRGSDNGSGSRPLQRLPKSRDSATSTGC
jgi:pimeloyl-ACP methyl ester carboxylesterase